MVGAVGSRPAWTRQLWAASTSAQARSHPARRIRPHRCRPRRSPRQRSRNPPLSRRAQRRGQVKLGLLVRGRVVQVLESAATACSPTGTRVGHPGAGMAGHFDSRRGNLCFAGSPPAARRPASISTGPATALGVGDSHGRQSGTERHSVCPGVDRVKGRGLGLLNCTLRERDRVQRVALGVVGVPRGGLRIVFVLLRVEV